MAIYGISIDYFIPIRKEPSEQSEMISQVVFGEHFEIIEQKDKWAFIKLDFDNYEGWIDKKSIQLVSDNIPGKNTKVIAKETVIEDIQNNFLLKIPAGSLLPQHEVSEEYFNIGPRKFKLKESNNIFYNKDIFFEEILKSFIHTPYLWGGRTEHGIDCSGFSQLFYKILGIKIPRDSSQQVKEGNTINFLEDTNVGDLAFFDNEEGEIYHVGIILSAKEIIHASGRVRIDKIDHQGIFNSEQNIYTHKLRIIKRLIES